jgi:hypothetical protein
MVLDRSQASGKIALSLATPFATMLLIDAGSQSGRVNAVFIMHERMIGGRYVSLLLVQPHAKPKNAA